jgi:hypothetical protein
MRSIMPILSLMKVGRDKPQLCAMKSSAHFGQCDDGDSSEAKPALAALNPHKAKDARPSPDGLPLKSGSALQVTAIVSMPLLTMSAGHVAAQ